MRIKQGTTYDIALPLSLEDGTDVTPENVSVVEISLGSRRFYYPGKVAYDDGSWTFHLSQEDTLAMSGVMTMKARAKTLTGEVAHADIGIVAVGESNSKEVL